MAHHTPPLGPDPYQFAPIKNSYWPHLNNPQWSQFSEYACLYEAVRNSGLPNHLKAKITVPSALNLPAWESLLANYHDKELCQFLRYGWPVGYTASAPPPPVNRNHDSATDFPEHIKRFLAKELKLGGLLGPFTDFPFTPWCHTAPLLTTPKKDSKERRVVLDLSYPKGTGVNGGITKNCLEGKARPYTLPSVEDLVTKVQILGPHCYLWKADLARAYRQLRTDPFDVPLLTVRFENQYWVDICPSFGARLSGAACQRTTTAVVDLLAKRGIWSLAYLDDFCGAAATLAEAETAYQAFLTLAETLGLSLSPSKCQPPTKAMEWLGFQFDTTKMTLTIPKTKLRDILQECTEWSSKKVATKKQVQSLAGKLNHISKCIRPARKFIGRILGSLRFAPERGSLFISNDFKADVSWFLNYAAMSNGLILLEPTNTEFCIDCDSSEVGGGGNSNSHYYHLTYDRQHIKAYKPICKLEAVNLLIAYRSLIPPKSAGLKIIIYTDNLGSQQALESGRTHDKVLAACTRQLWLEAATHNHTIVIRHKMGKKIPLADALSRQHQEVGRREAARLVAQRGLTRVDPALPHPMFNTI